MWIANPFEWLLVSKAIRISFTGRYWQVDTSFSGKMWSIAEYYYSRSEGDKRFSLTHVIGAPAQLAGAGEHSRLVEHNAKT
jgi:hypothetical protein